MMNATELFWLSVAKGQKNITDGIVSKIVSGDSGIEMRSLLDLANMSCHIETVARQEAVKAEAEG